MVAWWQQLARREQQVLLWGGGVLFLVCWYFFLIEPLEKKTQQLNEQIVTRQTQYNEMVAMRDKLQSYAFLLAPRSVEDILNTASLSVQSEGEILRTEAISKAQAASLIFPLAAAAKVTVQSPDVAQTGGDAQENTENIVLIIEKDSE